MLVIKFAKENGVILPTDLLTFISYGHRTALAWHGMTVVTVWYVSGRHNSGRHNSGRHNSGRHGPGMIASIAESGMVPPKRIH